MTRTVRRALVGAMAIGVLLGVGGPAAWGWSLEEAARPYKGTTVRIGISFVPVMEGILNLLKTDFEPRTGIKVELDKFTHAEYDAKMDADLFSRTGHYDLMQMHHNRFGDWVGNGHLRTFEEFLKNPKLVDPNLDTQDFLQPLWDDYCLSTAGKMCLPSLNFQMVYWYRKDLLGHPQERANFKKKYGYDLAPARTWQQYRDIAEFFTRKKGEMLAGKTLEQDMFGVGLVGKREQSLAWELSAFVQAFGGTLFDKDGVPTFTRKENVEAAKYWLGLRKFAPSGVSEAGFIDLFVILTKGIVAQAIQWTDFSFAIDDPKVSQAVNVYSYANIPVVREGMKSGGWGEAEPLVISKYSRNAEAAFLVAQYWASKDAQRKWITGPGSGLPLRKSSLEIPFVKQHPAFAPHINSMLRGWFNPGFSNWIEIQDEWVIGITETAAGRIRVEEAFQKAQAKALKIHPKGPVNPGQPTRNQFEPLK